MSRQMNSTERGFTIVELLVVVVVIAILAAIVIMAYNGITDRARTAVVVNELQSAQTKLETFKVTSPSEMYPTSTSSASIPNSTVGALSYDLYNNGSLYCIMFVNSGKTQRIWSDVGKVEEGSCLSKSNVSGIAKDSKGNTYILSYTFGGYSGGGQYVTGSASVAKYDPSFRTVLWARGTNGAGDGQIEASYMPWGVFVDPQDNVWVADTGNHRFEKFDSNGNLLFTLGGPTAGSATGMFNTQYGVAFTNNGNAYLADRYNNRVQKYTLGGTYVSTIATVTGAATLNQPHGMYVDASQNLYVASRGNNRVYKYDSTGAYVAMFGTGVGGNADGQLNSPTTVLVDPSNGDVYVYEINNSRISVFAANGSFVRSFTTLVSPITYNRCFSMIWDNGTILMAVQNANDNVRLQRFAKDGTQTELIRGDVFKI